jgi:hypothetical protein
LEVVDQLAQGSHQEFLFLLKSQLALLMLHGQLAKLALIRLLSGPKLALLWQLMDRLNSDPEELELS